MSTQGLDPDDSALYEKLHKTIVFLSGTKEKRASSYFANGSETGLIVSHLREGSWQPPVIDSRNFDFGAKFGLHFFWWLIGKKLKSGKEG